MSFPHAFSRCLSYLDQPDLLLSLGLLSLVFVQFSPIKKAGKRRSLDPPVSARANSVLFDGVPSPFMGDFKGSQVEIDLHLEPAFEPVWHSPRVPAGPTSTILECICYQYRSFLIYDFKLRR